MDDLDAMSGTEQDTPVSNEPASEVQEEPVDFNALEDAAEPSEEEGAQAPTPEEEAEASETERGLETVTLNGQEFEVPHQIKDAIMRDDDYTRKTQELAAQKRELEAAFEQANQQAQASDEYVQQRAALYNIETHIQEYEQVDWDAVSAQDPVGSQQHWMRYQQLKEARAEVVQGIQNFEQQRTDFEQQAMQQRYQRTDAWAQKNIPNWSNEKGVELVQFASQELGIPQAQVNELMSPVFAQVLHLAKLGHSVQQRANKPPQPSPKPLQKVDAKSSPPSSKSLAEMDMDEYVAARTSGRG